MRGALVIALGAALSVAAAGACEPINGGFIELHWQLASVSHNVVGCGDVPTGHVRLDLTPVSPASGMATSFTFDCNLQRAETGFVIVPGDYLAVLSALSPAGAIQGCSGRIFINVDFGMPSSLHVIEIQIGAPGCPT